MVSGSGFQFEMQFLVKNDNKTANFNTFMKLYIVLIIFPYLRKVISSWDFMQKLHW